MQLLVTDESKRLARWLRLIGYDTTIMSAEPLSQLYETAVNEGRWIITRNRHIKPGRYIKAVLLQHHLLIAQLKQLKKECQLSFHKAQLLTRCDQCNVPLSSIDKSKVKNKVPPYVYGTQDVFYTCASCQRIYWAATHAQRVHNVLDEVNR